MVASARLHATRRRNIAADLGAMITPADSTVLEFTFRELFDPGAWEALVAASELIDVPAGSVLMRRGELATPLYVVEEGTFEVVDARSSPETVLNLLGPGQVMGDMSFIDGAPVSAEVRARSHARCHRWALAELTALLDEQPALALFFYRALATTVVARSRTVMSAAVAGGFGTGQPLRAVTDAAELDRVVEALAADLFGPLADAASEADPRAAIQIADALTATCRWFTVASETGGAAEAGERLRDRLAEVLASSSTTAAMLARVEGSPAGPALFRHVLEGRPAGRDVAGILLDAALLQLPTLRGWRWRDHALAGALAGALPAGGARVLGITLSGAPTSDAQVAVLRGRGGHVDAVQLAPSTQVHEPPPAGVTRNAYVVDLPSLLRGAGPKLGGPHHAVLIDRVCDVVPDEVLRALLAWARLQLNADGQLIVAHAIPADDVMLLDHLLRWPSLPRRPASLVSLLPRGGWHTTVAPLDDEAAGLVSWRPRP